MSQDRAQHPAQDQLQRKLAWVVTAGLVANAAYWGWRMVVGSQHPDGYALRHLAGPWQYPVQGVITSLAIMVLEVGVAAWALRHVRSVAKASVGFALLFGIALVAALPLAMHAPDFIIMHLGALLVATAWCVVAAFGTGIASVIIQDREHERAFAPGVPTARVIEREH